MNGTSPKTIHMLEGLGARSACRVRAFVTVVQKEFAVTVVVSVGDLDVGKAKIGHI